jgi:hypothetical protein
MGGAKLARKRTDRSGVCHGYRSRAHLKVATTTEDEDFGGDRDEFDSVTLKNEGVPEI